MALKIKIVLTLCMLAFPVMAQETSNDVLKGCLAVTGYSPDKFDTFDFSKAAKCYSDYRIGKRNKEYEKLREFLKEKPWYKGTNWDWELTAKYKCNRIQSDIGPITLCSKPYYLN